MGCWTKSSYLLGVLLLTNFYITRTLSLSAAEDQSQDDTTTNSESTYDDEYAFDDDDSDNSTYDGDLLESFLDPGCRMEAYRDEEMTIVRENFSFHPVISIPDLAGISPSLTILTDSNESYPLNISDLPWELPLQGVFNLSDSTFKVQLPSLVSFNLTAVGVNDTNIRPKAMTFKRMFVTKGNCTNGLPFYKNLTAWLSPGDGTKMEINLLSTKDAGNTPAITGGTLYDWFSICYDGDGAYIKKRQKNWTISYDLDKETALDELLKKCESIPPRTRHLLTLRHDSNTKETKINETRFSDSYPGGFVAFYRGNYYVIICLRDCPRRAELKTPLGNATKEGDTTCVLDEESMEELTQLIVYVSIIMLALMVIDGSALLLDYVHRRFFYQPPEQDPSNLQWHLNVRPIPAYWQIPPPLPDRSPPSLTQSTLRRRLVVEEEEEDSD